MPVDEVARIETAVVFRTVFGMIEGSNEMSLPVAGLPP